MIRSEAEKACHELLGRHLTACITPTTHCTDVVSSQPHAAESLKQISTVFAFGREKGVTPTSLISASAQLAVWHLYPAYDNIIFHKTQSQLEGDGKHVSD